jgi:hypothetical protein
VRQDHVALDARPQETSAMKTVRQRICKNLNQNKFKFQARRSFGKTAALQ